LNNNIPRPLDTYIDPRSFRDEEAKAVKEKAANPKAKPKAKGGSKDKGAKAAEQKQKAEAKAAKKKEKEAKAGKPKKSKVKSGTLQEDWPVTFWSINTHLPEEDRVDLYPKYNLKNHITMSEIALARLMFENQIKRILKGVEPAEKQALQLKLHSFKNEMGFNNQTM
jgi:hypothetical protein